jgi:hypothetical protein
MPATESGGESAPTDPTPPPLRILFLTAPHEDYLADGLLHGLRTLVGPTVVDFPKSEFLYDSYPADRRADLYGHGFTLYGLLPDVPIVRLVHRAGPDPFGHADGSARWSRPPGAIPVRGAVVA